MSIILEEYKLQNFMGSFDLNFQEGIYANYCKDALKKGYYLMLLWDIVSFLPV